MTDDTVDRPRTGAIFPRPLLLCVVFAVLCTLLLTEIVPRHAPRLLRLDRFDVIGVDVRIAYLSDQLPSQHPHVAIVSISDQTLKDYKVVQPIDRTLLARVVDALDAAGAKAIGIDVLSTRVVPPDNQDAFLAAIRRAKAKVVLAALDERVGLSKPQWEQQAKFIADAGRPGGFVNLAIDHDWVIRFKARPAPDLAFPKSFAQLLAESAGYTPHNTSRRIAWLREPTDHSDIFLTVPAETLLGADNEGAKIARAGLKDKVVIIAGQFPYLDRHFTPLSRAPGGELMSGGEIHAQMAAELIDGRRIGDLPVDSWILKVLLVVVTALAFFLGWRCRFKNLGRLMTSAATAAIIAVDTFMFWKFRIMLPVVLAFFAWVLGEYAGHYFGRWLGPGTADRSRWFTS